MGWEAGEAKWGGREHSRQSWNHMDRGSGAQERQDELTMGAMDVSPLHTGDTLARW